MVSPVSKARRYYLDLLGSLHDVRAQGILAPLATSYLPWSEASLRPGAVVALLNEVVVARRELVLELGAGISTVFLGRQLRGTSGRVISVENDEQWLDLMSGLVKREGLEDVVSFVYAPLAEHTTPWGPVSWYEPSAITATLSPGSVDLLLVDGPLAGSKGKPHARYPAVPVLAPYLADDATVVLDDIHRAGEQEICSRWEREHGLTFARHETRGGYAIARRGRAWTI